MEIDLRNKTFEDSPGSRGNNFSLEKCSVDQPVGSMSSIQTPASGTIPSYNHTHRCVVENETSTAFPSGEAPVETGIEISHYPIETHAHPYNSTQLVRDHKIETDSVSAQPSTKSECRCSCHHTHHHHHHHTIVINGNSVTKTKNDPASISTTISKLNSLPRQGVLKTTSCPAWADGAPKNDRLIKTYNVLMNNEQFTNNKELQTPPHLLQNVNKNNSTSDGDNTVQHCHGEYQLRNQQGYRYCGAKGDKTTSCCPILSRGMVMLLVVLCLVILSLFAGLTYFLVRGNVTTTTPTETNVPEVSTVLNQTTICGKYPQKYLAISTRSTNKDQRQSNLHPPKNDNRINISQAARIIGGTYANIAEYPWQETSIGSKSVNSDELRDKSRIQPRIYGGTPSTAIRFPWQVHLHAVSLWVSIRGMVCGGSIILRDWVISAAHCTETNNDPALWTAYMGMSQISAKLDPPAQRSKIIKIIQHEHYVNNWSYDYDISLLKLETPVTFTPSVQPICIPHSTDDYKDGTKCYISGWGATSNSGQANNPNTLQHAQVNIIGYKTCRREDWLGQFVSDRMMCAGTYDGSRDACQGDSGGPLSCYDATRKAWTLAGSVSWGFDCGQPKQPGVYTKMTFFVDWIWTEIGKAEGWIPNSDNVKLPDDDLPDTGSAEGSASSALTSD